MSSTLFMALGITAASVGYMVFMRRRIAAQYAHTKLGELAPRLGLQVVEGDPAFNPVTDSVRPSVRNATSARGLLTQVAAANVGGTVGETRIRAVGQPYGNPTELVLYCREDLTPGLTTLTTTTWHDLRLSVQARRPIAPFDLRLRSETTGLETRRAPDDPVLPEQALADPALAQRFVLTGVEPGLAARIGPALGPIAHGVAYVHVVGAGDRVSFVMTPTSVSVGALALEQVLHVLAAIAAALDGRPAPGAGPA